MKQKNPPIFMCAGIKRKGFCNFRNTRFGFRLCLVCLVTYGDWWEGTQAVGPKQRSEGMMDLDSKFNMQPQTEHIMYKYI